MKKVLSSVIFALFVASCLGQVLRQAPFVGAVTENQARFYVRTSQATPVVLLLSTDSAAFSNPITVNGATIAADDSSGILSVTGLSPNTQYFYRIKINGTFVGKVQSFWTFPAPGTSGHFTFAYGSCQNAPAGPEPIFQQVIKANPRFFVQSGDWGYPDSTDNMPNNNDFYAADFNRVVAAYRARYSGPDMAEMREKVPVDYVYDDHDFVNDNSSKNSSSYYQGPYVEVAYPSGTRRNVIDAYTRFFPHYPLPDTSQGIYHSFRYGNIELFVIDNRSSRSPNLDALNQSSSTFTFSPPPGRTMLGDIQLNWLKNALRTSTATWKFIVGQVPFNKGYRRLIDALSGNTTAQIIGIPGVGSAKSLLSEYIEKWSGFPQEQDSILAFITQNNIQNVVFLSSDAHSSAMDDGRNAGLIEMMAGNLHQTNLREPAMFSTLGTILRTDLNIWNAGGQGIGNSNFNDAYGKVEVFGDDSLRLSLIDDQGVTFAKMTVCPGGVLCQVSQIENQKLNEQLAIFPNPATNSIRISLGEQSRANTSKGGEIIISSVVGQRVRTIYLEPTKSDYDISIADLPPGLYLVELNQANKLFARSFIKQ
ncbi:MAG: alkaline phosphatase D family protein [Bacteroidia bacterium]|nr:alkaline phosphatase D family protein [Bacteroidia bacterium]